MDRNDMLREQARLMAEARAIAEKKDATADDIASAEAKVAEAKGYDARMKLLEDTAPIAPVDAKTVPAEPKKVETFASLGEQLKAVVNFTRGTHQDRRLLGIQAAATGASEGVPADGGFLVQTDFTNELLKRTYAGGVLLPRVRRIGISPNSNGLTINAVDEKSRATGSRMGGIQAYWESEADAITASRPKFRKMELKLRKLTAAMYATDEILADASALGSLAQQIFPEEMRFMLEDAILTGDGVGKPLGITNSGAVVAVTKVANQAADTIVAGNAVSMYSRMWPGSLANAVWIYNQEAMEQLPQMTVGDQPVFMPAGGLTARPYGTLLGIPALPSEHCEKLGDQGDIYLIDPSQYILIDKDGIQTASSIHVQFLQAEQVFRFIYRVDGQPVWNSALTPFKATAGKTVSPYIAIEARA